MLSGFLLDFASSAIGFRFTGLVAHHTLFMVIPRHITQDMNQNHMSRATILENEP